MTVDDWQEMPPFHFGITPERIAYVREKLEFMIWHLSQPYGEWWL